MTYKASLMSLFPYFITWLFRRRAVLHTKPIPIRFKRMISYDMHLQDLDGALTEPQTVPGRDAITIVQMYPHSPCLKQLSRVMILIVTVGLEDINKALPVNPLPSAETKAWNFPADFLQWLGRHHHTLTAGERLNLHKGWAEWESLECCGSWVLTAQQGSRAAHLALGLCMLSVNHTTEPLNSSITVGYKSPFLQYSKSWRWYHYRRCLIHPGWHIGAGEVPAAT